MAEAGEQTDATERGNNKDTSARLDDDLGRGRVQPRRVVQGRRTPLRPRQRSDRRYPKALELNPRSCEVSYRPCCYELKRQ